MLTVWKYKVSNDDCFEIELPINSKLLSVQVQFHEVYLWCLVNPKEKAIQKRKFRLAGTGHLINENNLEFIGTFQLLNGGLVFHLFEILIK